jgi:hypothetical protein
VGHCYVHPYTEKIAHQNNPELGVSVTSKHPIPLFSRLSRESCNIVSYG